MRIFVGVELDDPVRQAAAAAAETLRRNLRRAAPDLLARWIAPENLHITIWFIGEVTDALADAISTTLREPPLRTPSFDLSLDGCGAFPPSGAPRVFWVGLRDGIAGMAALYAEVGERLGPLGYEPEKRPYTAHLTLARVKAPGHARPRIIREAVAGVPPAGGTCRVSALTLFQSRLSPKGARYDALLRVPLED